MKDVPELRELVFETLFEYMLASGGDGDGCLCCRNWEEAANHFEAWLFDRHPNFLKRRNQEGSVVFENDQEGIVITDYDYNPPSWIDCVIKVSRI